jgi:methoxymalonate biosynthesis acyl carrier protein
VTADQTVSPVTAEQIQQALGRFLQERVKTEVAVQQDLFKSGLVSSMFAMELVVHLEEEYDIAIIGPDLKLDSFRTIEAMTELVLRLSAAKEDSGV